MDTPDWACPASACHTALALNPAGKVLVQGELWDAELRNINGPAPVDSHLVVVGREGFHLYVAPAPQEHQ